MIKWSTDNKIANEIVKHPNVWGFVGGDAIDKDKFVFPEVDGIKLRMALCYNANELAGCFFFLEHDENTTEIHVCMTKKGIGKRFCDKIVDFVFSGTEYRQIYAIVPVCNVSAKKMALSCGFTYIGMGDQVQRNGQLVDTEILRVKKWQS